MSEKTPHRRPATFKLDDPGVIVMGPDETGRPARGTVHITPEADPATLPVPIDAPRVPARRGFRWGTLFWSAVGGLVLLGLRPRHRQPDRGPVRAQPDTGLCRAGIRRRRGAGAGGRHRARSLRAGAAGGDRKAASARRRSAAQRRPRREPRRRQRPAQARASEPATGPRPRRAGEPCRRHHRRRRHDQARRARIDGAAR